ncbi:MAG: FAD-dependent oxidoreductase [Anaerolineales bacterium]|nr:FAD-dependent oxidoreductase [Anaerolineales bacterium]
MTATIETSIGDQRGLGPLAINHSRAIYEAQRCLYCFNAPCTQACPVHIDIPGFIKRIQEDNLEGSYEILFQPNPFATVCGLACPTTDLCEGACVLPDIGQRPIQIGALQYYVARNLQIPEKPGSQDRPEKVAIVGGGPSGLSCAIALRRIGHDVHLFESNLALGGLMEQVIPAYRLPQDAIDHDLGRLSSLGIDVSLGHPIDTGSLEKIVEEFAAIFLCPGLQKRDQLSISGMELSGVGGALEYLQAARLFAHGEGPQPELGECVVVVGGGNVALDTASMAKRLGTERVVVLYRRTMKEMPGWRSEFIEAASLGIEFRWLSTMTRIKGMDGEVRSVEVQPMRLTITQEDGRRGVEPDPISTPYEFPCNSILIALGQSLDPELVNALSLSVNTKGMIDVYPDTFQTANPKIFAGGEAISGGATIVQSIAQGMAAGKAIHSWLSSQGSAK